LVGYEQLVGQLAVNGPGEDLTEHPPGGRHQVVEEDGADIGVPVGTR
jgi:hypothetical protein